MSHWAERDYLIVFFYLNDFHFVCRKHFHIFISNSSFVWWACIIPKNNNHRHFVYILIESNYYDIMNICYIKINEQNKFTPCCSYTTDRSSISYMSIIIIWWLLLALRRNEQCSRLTCVFHLWISHPLFAWFLHLHARVRRVCAHHFLFTYSFEIECGITNLFNIVWSRNKDTKQKSLSLVPSLRLQMHFT